MTKQAHNMDTHTDIVRYARKLSEEIERAAEPDTLMEMDDEPLDLVDWLNDQLSLEIWTKNTPGNTSFKAEILITCGGPTVRLDLDSRFDRADLYHSWGWHNGKEEELTRWELSTKASSLLVDLIEELAE
jgi:hypothetical protein